MMGILGLFLLFLGLSWFVLAIRRHPHLLRISGTVVNVEEMVVVNKWNQLGGQ